MLDPLYVRANRCYEYGVNAYVVSFWNVYEKCRGCMNGVLGVAVEGIVLLCSSLCALFICVNRRKLSGKGYINIEYNYIPDVPSRIKDN